MKINKIKMLVAALCTAGTITVTGQVNATVYDITGDVTLAGVHVFTQSGPGTYDNVTGIGSWDLHIDGTAVGFGISDLSQTFTMDGITGTGAMDPGTCTGDAVTCAVMGAGLAGAWSSNITPIAAGPQVWTLAYTQVGPAPFDITLTAVPVPAAAWLFGSALVGLSGIGRKRNLAK